MTTPSSQTPGRGGPGHPPQGQERPVVVPAPPAFPHIITTILHGEYRPTPGTAGAVLLQAHPSNDRFTAGRSLAIFAKVAVRQQGLWWVMALEAMPNYLAADEEDYLAAAWRQWCNGANPFTGGRNVTA